MFTINISGDEIRKKKFKPFMMDMNVFHPRKHKVFSSPKDYKRNQKHKGKGWD